MRIVPIKYDEMKISVDSQRRERLPFTVERAVRLERQHFRSDSAVDLGFYFPLSLGSLIGTCREVLTTLGLPSGWVRRMAVSSSRMNFSASMCVASLTITSPVLSGSWA
jgi:hypothetical protein